MKRKHIDRLAWTKSIKGAIGPSEKATPPRSKRVTMPERDLQSMAEDLCDALGVRWFRIPDAILSHLHNFAPAWCRVFVSRYLKGVPDLMLFKKSESGDNITRFIEIKTEVGKVSQGQRHWHRGLDVRVCYGWDQVEKEIKDFEAGPRPDSTF